jgi:alpha-glucosidase (family GH31 glycosyl hydrolase)
MSLSLNATHPSDDSTEYNVHSLYGHMQSKITKEFLMGADSVLPGKKPFILSRSTFATSGKYAAHSLGENY